MPSPWSPTFEPLFAILGAVATWLYVRAWRASVLRGARTRGVTSLPKTSA